MVDAGPDDHTEEESLSRRSTTTGRVIVHEALTQMNSLKKTYLSDAPTGAYNAKDPAIPSGVKLILSSAP